MKNSLEGFKGLFEQAEERTSKPEVRTREIIEPEIHKEKKKTLKKTKYSLSNLWETIIPIDIFTGESKEMRERDRS